MNRPLQTLLKQHVDKIFVITVPQRKAYVKKVLEAWKLEATIFPAIDKNQLDCEALKEVKVLSQECRLTLGQIACNLSHFELYRRLLEEASGPFLILEDDILPPPPHLEESIQRLAQALEHLPQTYDLFYLGRANDNRFTVQSLSESLLRTYAPSCTHAMMVSPQGAKKMLELGSPIQRPFDLEIKRQTKKRSVEAYALTPPLFFQNREDLPSSLDRKTTFFGLGGGNQDLNEYSFSSQTLHKLLSHFRK